MGPMAIAYSMPYPLPRKKPQQLPSRTLLYMGRHLEPYYASPPHALTLSPILCARPCLTLVMSE